MILTDKLGDSVLPSVLQVEDFETVFNKVSEHSNPQRAELEREIASIQPSSNEGVGPSEHSNEKETKVEPNEAQSEPTKAADPSSQVASGQPSNQAAGGQAASGQRKEAAGESKKDQQRLRDLRERLARLPNPALLTTWYKLDENAAPAVYRLQNIGLVVE